MAYAVYSDIRGHIEVSIASIIMRSVCLISITQFYVKSSISFKIDEFYAYSVYFGLIIEPLCTRVLMR
jgi:hypothetical protein